VSPEGIKEFGGLENRIKAFQPKSKICKIFA
jgi:hypothetical protein